MTAAQATKAAEEIMRGTQTPEPLAKAKVIAAHVLDIGLGETGSVISVSERDADAILAMAQRCAAGEPVEYVTGKAYFRHVQLRVDESVLIPRQETELVAQQAIDLIRANGYKKALDLCTGSGCIAISLATETDATVTAADISEAALETARKNAAANSANIEFLLSDMFQSIHGEYDIIVCNPPYVSEAEYAVLHKSVREHEPKPALIAGDGLKFYRTIAVQAGKHIAGSGALVLEIGAGQGASVKALLESGGFSDVAVLKDYSRRERIVTARR